MKGWILLMLVNVFACQPNGKKISQAEPAKVAKLIADSLQFKAKVIGVTDGDTVEVLWDSIPTKIRLAHIDAPEKRGSQPFGMEAKKMLSDLCFGQEVMVVSKGKNGQRDRSQRLIAVIKNQIGANCNLAMVRNGLAWHYVKYSTDSVYSVLEAEARAKKLGLWAEPNPVAPWLWRKKKKSP